MSETVDNMNGTGANKRPAFLTVLCILSFVAAGFSIIGLALLSAGKGAVEAAGGTTDLTTMEGMPSMPSASTEALAQAQAALSWPSIIGSIALTLIGLFGVIMMWKLNKKGYFVYVGAAVAGIILPIILGAGFSAFGAVISVAFIVMYGLNLKHMK